MPLINQYLISILNIQDCLNKLIDREWILNDYGWSRTLLIGAARFYNDIGYKWWENQPTNIDAAKDSLVDMLSSLLSVITYEHGWENTITIINEAELENVEPFVLPEILIDDCIEKYFAKDYKESLMYLYLAMKKLEMTDEDMLFAYIHKNVLKIFVQNNGIDQLDCYDDIVVDIAALLDRITLINRENLLNNLGSIFDDVYNLLSREYESILMSL